MTFGVSLRRLYSIPYCPATWLMKPVLSNCLRIEWSTKRSGFIKLMSAAEAGPTVTISIPQKDEDGCAFHKIAMLVIFHSGKPALMIDQATQISDLVGVTHVAIAPVNKQPARSLLRRRLEPFRRNHCHALYFHHESRVSEP